MPPSASAIAAVRPAGPPPTTIAVAVLAQICPASIRLGSVRALNGTSIGTPGPETIAVKPGYRHPADALKVTHDRRHRPPPEPPVRPPPAGWARSWRGRRCWRSSASCVIAGLGWLYLGLLIGDMGGPAADLGPGMGAFDLLPRALDAICSPTFGLGMPHGAWGATGFALVALMWVAMTLAMMLPTAGPMIFTYAEIADTAAQKGERIVSPFVLAAGYTAVWLGFAVAGDAGAVRAHAARADRRRHGLGERAVLGRDLHRRRALSVLRAQARLPARSAGSRSRSSSPTGRPRRAACSGSASSRACSVSAAAGR